MLYRTSETLSELFKLLMFSQVGSEKSNLNSSKVDVPVALEMAVAAMEEGKEVSLASGLPKGVEVEAESAFFLFFLVIVLHNHYHV